MILLNQLKMTMFEIKKDKQKVMILKGNSILFSDTKKDD